MTKPAHPEREAERESDDDDWAPEEAGM